MTPSTPYSLPHHLLLGERHIQFGEYFIDTSSVPPPVQPDKPFLEVFDERQAQTIDQIEVGRRISGQIRFALQVPDLDAAAERLLAHGATLVHPAVVETIKNRGQIFEEKAAIISG